MSDIAERLLKASRGSCIYEDADACTDAIKEIDALRAEVERLQEALRQAYIGLISLAPEEDQGRIAEAMAKNCGGGTLLSPAPRLSDPTTGSREG